MESGTNETEIILFSNLSPGCCSQAARSVYVAESCLLSRKMDDVLPRCYSVCKNGVGWLRRSSAGSGALVSIDAMPAMQRPQPTL
ncbi:hypothetical protein KQX54_002744 [Cotesia glomerata]|uniref:Uncharacterized protein n=1 Tax=Cotesia glomerata TaxID=32391 RepID=A0AAV7J3T7_COTGL|nr:hypothetical protein KQX54_002744 [Cotesia glomerata]